MNSQTNFNDEDFGFDYMKVIQRDDSDSRSIDLEEISEYKTIVDNRPPETAINKQQERNDNSSESEEEGDKVYMSQPWNHYGIESSKEESQEPQNNEIIDINRETIYEHTVFDEDEDLSEEDDTYFEGKKVELVRKSMRNPYRIKAAKYVSKPLAKKQGDNEENILPEDLKESADHGDMFVPISFEIIEDGFLIKSLVKITFWKFSIGTRVHEVKIEEVSITQKVTLFVDDKEIYANYE